jgi:hypothetical protein
VHYVNSLLTTSKKIIHGDELRARANSWRTARSLSPTNLLRSSGPCLFIAEILNRLLHATNLLDVLCHDTNQDGWFANKL